MKWFSHDTNARRDPKLKGLVRAHGLTGIALWWSLLEELYEAEGQFTIKADALWLDNFAYDLNVTDPRTLTRVFDTFADLGLISKQLWEGEQQIYVEAIAKRGDAYIKSKMSNAERQARYRERQKQKKEEELQRSNGRNALSVATSNEMTLQRSDNRSHRSDTETDRSRSHTQGSKKRVCAREENFGESIPEKIDKLDRWFSQQVKAHNEQDFEKGRGDRPYLPPMELQGTGYEWLWTGEGQYNAWKPEFIEVVKQHLKAHEKPYETANCCQWIANRLRDADIATIAAQADRIELLSPDSTQYADYARMIEQEFEGIPMKFLYAAAGDQVEFQARKKYIQELKNNNAECV